MAATVKFRNNFALARQVPFAERNMPLALCQMLFKHFDLHCGSIAARRGLRYLRRPPFLGFGAASRSNLAGALFPRRQNITCELCRDVDLALQRMFSNQRSTDRIPT